MQHTLFITGEELSHFCKDTQHFDYGGSATIQCHFPENFYSVYWYNSAEVRETPIISLKDSMKIGDGYTSGEFDITSDGSLIINKVTLQHNHTFSVAIFLTKDADPIVRLVLVIVKGKIFDIFGEYRLVLVCTQHSDIS